jgi:hypothetical protein
MPAPSRKKKREETRTNEELALLSAMNSDYTLMYPMVNAEHVRIRNPLTGRDPVFKTNSDSFREMIVQLCDKGLDKKISKEFDLFAEKYDSKWAQIKKFAMPNNFTSIENSPQ